MQLGRELPSLTKTNNKQYYELRKDLPPKRRPTGPNPMCFVFCRFLMSRLELIAIFINRSLLLLHLLRLLHHPLLTN